MADLITELNGTFSQSPRDISSTICNIATRISREGIGQQADMMTTRFLWSNEHILLPPLLSRRRIGSPAALHRHDFHAIRTIFRFHGWKGREMAPEVIIDGTGA
jgi:hypothetical protein